MQKSEKASLLAIREVLDPHGMDVRLNAAARHPRVEVRAPGGWHRTIVIPCSPRSDATSQANFARQAANRVLAEWRGARAA